MSLAIPKGALDCLENVADPRVKRRDKRNGLVRTSWISDGPKGNVYDAGDLDT